MHHKSVYHIRRFGLLCITQRYHGNVQLALISAALHCNWFLFCVLFQASERRSVLTGLNTSGILETKATDPQVVLGEVKFILFVLIHFLSQSYYVGRVGFILVSVCCVNSFSLYLLFYLQHIDLYLSSIITRGFYLHLLKIGLLFCFFDSF